MLCDMSLQSIYRKYFVFDQLKPCAKTSVWLSITCITALGKSHAWIKCFYP